MSYLDELYALKGKTAVVIGGGGVLAGIMAEGLAKAGANTQTRTCPGGSCTTYDIPGPAR